MTRMSRMNRRSFVIASGAAGAGLALGFNLPFGRNFARADAVATPEVDAWVERIIRWSPVLAARATPDSPSG